MNSPTIIAMQGVRAQRWTSWIGVMLILMNLLAPTVSHAVRHAKGTVSAASTLNAWCSPLARLKVVDQVSTTGGSSERHQAPVSEHACGYCVAACLNIGVPTAPTQGVEPPIRSATLTTDTETRAPGIEPPRRHRSRAPPLPASA